jgi:hypothetical protein
VLLNQTQETLYVQALPSMKPANDCVVASLLSLVTKTSIHPPDNRVEEVQDLDKIRERARCRIPPLKMDQLVKEYRCELVGLPRSDAGRWQQDTGL